jgi:hypothetical protein
MNMQRLAELTEKLRINVIGNPVWIPEKTVFEYPKQTIEVVVILKLIRAVQGLQSQVLLCQAGLFIDTFSLYRCVGDCVEEIAFLLEKYPEQSDLAKKFIENFFKFTIDNCTPELRPVSKSEIHSANARHLTGQRMDEEILHKMKSVYKTFCGYIHANYAHIMEIYGGSNRNFNLLGVPSKEQIEMRMQIVQESYNSVLFTAILICLKFKETEIASEFKKLCKAMDE